MPPLEPQENPFASPRAVEEAPSRPRPIADRSFGRASFAVGAAERHVVTVECSMLTGRESFLVDGVESLRTYLPWGRRRLVVGSAEQHVVEFRVSPLGRICTAIDGVETHCDLLPEVRWLCTLAVAWLVLALAFVSGTVLLM
jgi:hypothetical protein